MRDEAEHAVIVAVQIGPAEFFVAAEGLQVGDEFGVDDYSWQVIGEPVEADPGVLIVPVCVTGGPETGEEFQAHVRVGRHVGC